MEVITNKICKKCNVEKPIGSFSTEKHHKSNRLYTRNTCRICKNKQVNTETVRARHCRWNSNHQEYRKQWRKDNRQILSKKESVRYKSDINFKLRKILRASLKTRLKRFFQNESKIGSSVKDLGCSISEFKIYIENKFESEMSWDNYGQWHLDHIKPLASFDLTNKEEFLRANHYTNYQPLWAKDNLKKGAKYE